jgi:SAM-dependent methyltransferase/uncharacterized protein YbaR (Trm112 family)
MTGGWDEADRSSRIAGHDGSVGRVGATVELTCPIGGLPLRPCSLQDAERLAGSRLAARARGLAQALEPTAEVLVSADASRAYPVISGVPVLLAPEALCASGATRVSRDDQRYAEAYEEMAYYNPVAGGWAARLGSTSPHGGRRRAASDDPVDEGRRLARMAKELASTEACTFPDPPELWLHLRFESAALRDAYAHLAPLSGQRLLQIGGLGLDAVKFLLAGAKEVWLASPMLGELSFARILAALCGVEDRLRPVLAVGEELPFAAGSFDSVYAGGSLHHMVTSLALPECRRVLRAGGRFASVEPWRGPGYGLGTGLLGKREAVRCKPLTPVRLRPLFDTFEAAAAIHHGALTRYPLVALSKFGIKTPMSAVRRLTKVDDLVSSAVPRLRATGSSVAIVAARA